MDTIKDVISWFAEQVNPSSALCIRTADNSKVLECSENTVNQSAVLTLCKKYQTRYQAKYPEKKLLFRIPELQHKDCLAFIKAIHYTEQQFGKLSREQCYNLLEIAYKFKSPLLYGILLQLLLPKDIDKQIAHLIFRIQTLHNLVMAHRQDERSEVILPPYNSPTIAAEFNHDGDYYLIKVASLSSNNEREYNCHLFPMVRFGQKVHFANYNMITLNPTRNYIALGNNNKPCSLRLFEIDTKESTILNEKCIISALIFSPDGHYLAVGFAATQGQSLIGVWNIDDLEGQSYTLDGHTQNIGALAFSPHNTYLASGSPETKNSIILWNISDINAITSETIFTNGHHHFTGFIFNSDNTMLVAKTNRKLNLIFYLAPNKEITYASIIASNKIPFIDPNRDTHYEPDIYAAMHSIPYAQQRDGSLVVTVPSDGAFHIHNVQKEYSMIQHRHTFPITSLNFSKNFFLSCSLDRLEIRTEEGNIIRVIMPGPNRFLNATLNPQETHILSVDTKDYRHNCLTMHTISNASTQKILSNIDNTLSTPQAIVLNALCLYKSHNKNNACHIKNISLEKQVIEKFEQEKKKFLEKQLSISYCT